MTENFYPPGWWQAKQDGVAMSPEEIADYNVYKKTQNVSMSAERVSESDIPYTQEEEEAFVEKLHRLAGTHL